MSAKELSEQVYSYVDRLKVDDGKKQRLKTLFGVAFGYLEAFEKL